MVLSLILEKYQAGIQQQADREWSAYEFPIALGARGYVNKRVHGYFLQLGIDRKSATSTIRIWLEGVAMVYGYTASTRDFKPFRLN